MPEIKDIDKLKDRINSLGDEPAIMAELGEEIPDVKPVPDEVPDDISALLGSFSDMGDDLEPDASLAGDDSLFSDAEESEDFSYQEEEASLEAPEEPEDFSYQDEESAKDETEKGGHDSLEDFFGDGSVDIDESPDRLIDSFSAEEGDDTGTLDLGAFDDLFPGEELPSFDEDLSGEELPSFDEDLSGEELPSFDEDLSGEGFPSFDEDLSAEDTSAEDFELAEAGPSDSAGEFSGEEDFSLPDDFDSGFETAPPAFDETAKDFLPESDETQEEKSDDDFDIGALDSISLDDEFEEPAVPAGESIDLEELPEEEFGELGELEEESGVPEGDEFSLEDLGEEFGNIDELEEIETKAEETVSEMEYDVKPDAVSAVSAEDIYISTEKLSKVTETLSSYPGNLKFFIEDLIGNKELSGTNLDTLVDRLAAGASAREVSDLLFKITGKRVRIPAQYERKTWEELEREKATFAWLLKHRIIPYTARTLLFGFAALFLFFVINNFLWKPLYSTWLYNKGYGALLQQNYSESERFFIRASNVKPYRKQFYRYADTLVEKREYALAENKYIQMLGISLSSEREKPARDRTMGYFPGDKKGFLGYSKLKTFYQGDFSSSERIIDDYISLKGNKWDYEMLVRKADNYLNWAEIDSSKFDSAEYVINDSLSKFGAKPEFFFRRIALFTRSGKLDRIREHAYSFSPEEPDSVIEKRKYYGILGQFRGYVESIKEKHLDPYIATGFYRYLIDSGEVDELERSLVSVSNIDKQLVEPHYQLSRLWKFVGKHELERESLEIIENLSTDYSLDHIRDNYPHSYMHAMKERKNIIVFTLNRLGKFEYNDGSVLSAQNYYQQAISEYENSLDLLGQGPDYGVLYEDLGDIYYYSAGKFSEAYREYRKAESTGYRNDNLSYKIGFIHYWNKNYRDSAEKFYEISIRERDNESVLFAFANSSFHNGVFSPARAYYEQVVDKLEYWRDHQGLLELDRRRDQRLVLEKLMQVYNNLGVALYKLSERDRNTSYYSNALVYFTKSAELYDLLSRDPETLDRSMTRPLAQLNMRYALVNAGRQAGPVTGVVTYSSENMEIDSPVIYNTIDQDMSGRVQLITAY